MKNPKWTTPVWQREVFLPRPKKGRGFMCLPEKHPFYQDLTCIKSRGRVSLSRAESREREQSFTRAEDILGCPEQSCRLRLP